MGRPRKQQADIYVATDDGIWNDPDGVPHPFFKDQTRVRAGHRMLEEMPQSFKPITVHYDVERFYGEDTETRLVARA